MLRFALKTLLADKGKLLIALLGVVFSLVLVHIQGGLFIGMVRKTSILIDYGEADIWVGHRGMRNTDATYPIPVDWIQRVRGLSGVTAAEPYIVSLGSMVLADGHFEDVLVVGSEPRSMLGSAWAFRQGSRTSLRAPDAVSVDALDGWRLGDPQVNSLLEINGRRARVAALTDGILNFISTPYVFCDLEAARNYTGTPGDFCSFYLVKAAPGADREDLCRRIRERVPELDVYTAEEFSYRTRMYWTVRTGLGMNFGGSTVLGLTVGLVMVAQSLYAFVLEHQSDYATLKALGAEDWQVYRVLLVQGISIAAAGSALGTLCGQAIRAAASSPYLPIEIPWWLTALAVSLAVAICLISAMLPFARIRRADPATLLQS